MISSTSRHRSARRSARRATVIVVAAMVGATVACSSSASRAADHPSPNTELVEAVKADLVAHPKIPGEAVSVRAPGLDLEAARGFADVAGKVPLRVETPFRIASVTKTFVAAAVLRLVEARRVVLDAPISHYLSSDTVAVLTSGGYQPGRITVRELLDHSSGLFDYATSNDYDQANVNDPGHQWTRREQLQLAMTHGRPVGEPGRAYHYSDTNYILLGELLERTTGLPLAAAVRDEIGFERLGLDHTSWESLEPAPTGQPARAHQYYDTTFDNIALDASSDLYGGGGLVSTVGDLTRFFRGLFNGQVFADDSTLDEMLKVSTPGRRAGAALGIFRAKIAGETCWGHPGYWGTEAYYCPRTAVAFALATNQANEADLDTTAVEHTIVDLARRATRPPTRVLLMGDSLTAFNGTRVAELLGSKYQTTNAGIGGTSLLDANVCDGSRARRLIKRYDPQIVVVEYTGNYAQTATTGQPICGPRLPYASRQFLRAWKQSAQLNQRLLSASARVLWVEVPMPGNAYRAAVPGINEAYRSVAGSPAGLVDAWKPFGGPSYRADLHLPDRLHLNRPGNELLAKLIAAKVRTG
ncbi:MAG: DUF459 domain-containing protein [Acidimicrobiia bacterium]